MGNFVGKMLGTVCAVLIVLVGSTQVAAAAPPPSVEYPTSWVFTSESSAVGTTPSGVVVTASLTGAPEGTDLRFALAGPSIIVEPRPDYLPEGEGIALWALVAGCTQAPCGTLEYTFSVPIESAVLQVGDQGAILVDTGLVTASHSSPISALDGATFTYSSPDSHNPLSVLSADGTTLSHVSSDLMLGLPEDPESCGTLFACFSADVVVPAPVTVLRFELGYEGSGDGPDGFPTALGVVPSEATFTGSHRVARVNGEEVDPGVLVRAGDAVTFDAGASNEGGRGGSTTLTETVPEGSTYVGVDEGWLCPPGSPAGTTCSQTVDIEPGGSTSRAFTIAVYDEVPGTIKQLVATLTLAPGRCPQCTVALDLAPGAAPTPTLAATGSSTPGLWLPTLIVFVGGALVVASRRRARTTRR